MNSYKASINTTEMSHEEWLETRRIGIGGSDVPAILGFDKYRTPLDVYNDKVSDTIIEKNMTAKMKAGLKLEDVIAEWFSEETGYKVLKDNKIRIHKHIPFFIANIDRLIVGHNGEGSGVLEIKTTSGYIAKNWDAGDVPLNYYSQLQHYLNVTGYKYGYIAVLIDGWDFRAYRYERDDEFIEMMTGKLIEFWKCVEIKTPPEPQTRDDLMKLYPMPAEGKIIEATEETYRVYKDLCEVRRQIKQLEEAEEEFKLILQKIMKDAERIEYNGETLITWKQTKDRQKFDAKIFKKDHPDLYKTYSVSLPGSRVFLIKEREDN